jgi:branched-chain amino acid transport system permease protein
MGNWGKRQNIILLLFALLFVGTLPAWGSSYYLSLVTSVFLYVILTVSWSAFSAPTGYMSLASAAFFGVGVYPWRFSGRIAFCLVILIAGVLSAFWHWSASHVCLKGLFPYYLQPL